MSIAAAVLLASHRVSLVCRCSGRGRVVVLAVMRSRHCPSVAESRDDSQGQHGKCGPGWSNRLERDEASGEHGVAAVEVSNAKAAPEIDAE